MPPEPADRYRLSVTALSLEDAQAAERGGADLVHLVGDPTAEGLSPTPDLVDQVCQALTIPVWPLLRLRDGYGTDGGEFTRLVGLASSYRGSGAAGLVTGFLTPLGVLDAHVCSALIEAVGMSWICDRAIDQSFDYERSWLVARQLPLLEQVLTAGSARGVEHGLDRLTELAQSDSSVRDLATIAGGLATEDVPWLVRSGYGSFHCDYQVRRRGNWSEPVDIDHVRAWRRLLDDQWRRMHPPVSLPSQTPPASTGHQQSPGPSVVMEPTQPLDEADRPRPDRWVSGADRGSSLPREPFQGTLWD